MTKLNQEIIQEATEIINDMIIERPVDCKTIKSQIRIINQIINKEMKNEN